MPLERFNEESEKPWFTFKANPLVKHAWHIMEYKPEKNDYEPVGEYVLIDLSETIDITEKRLMNLVGILNRKKNLIDFKSLTNTRVLFTMVQDTLDSKTHKIVYRTYDGKGVSKENAVLTIDKGVFQQ